MMALPLKAMAPINASNKPLARAGEVPEMEARKIVVKSLELRVKSDFPINSPLLTLNFSVTCSKGTYIRSLARDIALKLGTVGHVSALRRTKSGVFALAHAISLENLEESAKEGAVLDLLQPAHAVLDDITVLTVNEEEAINLRHGKALIVSTAISDSVYQARLGDELIAIGQVSEKIFKSQRVFNVTSKGDH
jgi:tRNA pseudouridine55 synthase